MAAAEGKQTRQSTESTERDNIERMRPAGGGGEHAYCKTIDRDDNVYAFLLCLLYSLVLHLMH